MEIVHVELTNKGSQIVVLEICGKNFLTEFGRLFNNKSSAFRIPIDNFREFSFFKNVVGFADEGRDGVLSVSLGFGFIFTSQFGSHWKKSKKKIRKRLFYCFLKNESKSFFIIKKKEKRT